MNDPFKEKSKDWDAGEMAQMLSAAIGAGVLEAVPLQPEWTVMDFGAGTGLICSHVAPSVSEIIAVDISQAMLDVLVQKDELRGKVQAVCQDILEKPLGRSFDLIMSAMALHHVQDTSAVLKAFSEHLAQGGMLALADLDSEDGTFHPAEMSGVYHAGFDRQQLGELLIEAGYSDIWFQTVHTIERNEQVFPVFLVTAVKG